MIVERLQHFVRSLRILTDGTPRKLVFFRIGGISSSSRIEYNVTGTMADFTSSVKEIDTQLIRYLRGALDVEVVPADEPYKPGGMRVDIFLIIWKALTGLSEDDAEQLFWGEPDVGIVRSAYAGSRVQDSIRTPFSNLLLDYYSSAPKPIQSFFVDHPEYDAESFYQQLLILLVIGELECLYVDERSTLQDEGAGQDGIEPTLPEWHIHEHQDSSEETIVMENEPQVPPAIRLTPPESDDDYIDSLINTRALDQRANASRTKTMYPADSAQDESSLKLLFMTDTGTAPENAIPDKRDEHTELDLLQESIQEDQLPEEFLTHNETSDTQISKETMSIPESFDHAFDAPLPADTVSPQQKARKIAGLQKILAAAKNGF